MLQVYLSFLSSFYLPFVPLFSFLKFLISVSSPYLYCVSMELTQLIFTFFTTIVFWGALSHILQLVNVR